MLRRTTVFAGLASIALAVLGIAGPAAADSAPTTILSDIEYVGPIAVSPDGNYLAVGAAGASFAIYSLPDLDLVTTYATGGNYGIAWSADSTAVYVSGYWNPGVPSQMHKFDVVNDTRTTVDLTIVGGLVESIFLSEDGATVFAVERDQTTQASQLVRLNASDLTSAGSSLALPAQSHRATRIGTTAFVTGQDLTRVDLTAWTLSTRTLAHPPYGNIIAATSEEAIYYFSTDSLVSYNWTDDSFNWSSVAYDGATPGIWGFALTANGERIYIASAYPHELTSFSAADGSQLAQITDFTIPPGEMSMSADDSTLYFTVTGDHGFINMMTLDWPTPTPSPSDSIGSGAGAAALASTGASVVTVSIAGALLLVAGIALAARRRHASY